MTAPRVRRQAGIEHLEKALREAGGRAFYSLAIDKDSVLNALGPMLSAQQLRPGGPGADAEEWPFDSEGGGDAVSCRRQAADTHAYATITSYKPKEELADTGFFRIMHSNLARFVRTKVAGQWNLFNPKAVTLHRVLERNIPLKRALVSLAPPLHNASPSLRRSHCTSNEHSFEVVEDAEPTWTDSLGPGRLHATVAICCSLSAATGNGGARAGRAEANAVGRSRWR